MSPALAGRFLTTGPPGKSQKLSILMKLNLFFFIACALGVILFKTLPNPRSQGFITIFSNSFSYKTVSFSSYI